MPHTHNRARAALESGTLSCRRRPLQHEGRATLALRKLNRPPSGVPPLWPLLPREQGCLAAYPQSLRQHASRSIEQPHTSKPVLDKEERNATLFGSMRTARMEQPRTRLLKERAVHRTPALEYIPERRILTEGRRRSRVWIPHSECARRHTPVVKQDGFPSRNRHVFQRVIPRNSIMNRLKEKNLGGHWHRDWHPRRECSTSSSSKRDH